VNLPAGSSVTFSVDAQVVGTPSGTLDNTASVTAPGGVTDSNPANNNAFDSDVLIVSSGTSYGNFGPGQDNNIELLPEGGPFITLTLSSPITVPGSDLILYEQDAGTLPPTIMMDQIIVEVSDGDNWYTVFNWGDGSSDFASGVAIPLGAPNPTNCAGEPDNCVIDASFLVGTPATGITVDLDALSPPIPNGAVIRFIRFRAPAGGDGDGAGFDGFSFVP
jgi:hypothetical protein